MAARCRSATAPRLTIRVGDIGCCSEKSTDAPPPRRWWSPGASGSPRARVYGAHPEEILKNLSSGIGRRRVVTGQMLPPLADRELIAWTDGRMEIHRRRSGM